MKKALRTAIVIVPIALLIMVPIAMGIHHYLAEKTARTNQIAVIAPLPPGAQAVSPDWLAAYDEWKKLSEGVAARQRALTQDPKIKQLQADSDRAMGLMQRLRSGLPTGYLFDEKLRSFVPAPAPPAPTPVTPPKDASGPSKKP